VSEEFDITEMVKPWTDYHGDLPDYDHPLRCVYESGIQYAVELLAKELGVEDYAPCDGTEEFDGDLGGTLMNIVLEAMPKDEHGDPIYPKDLTALARPLPADVEALAERLETASKRLDYDYTDEREAISAMSAAAAALRSLAGRVGPSDDELRAFTRAEARATALEAENARLRTSLLGAEAAISEFYRYQTGGETRGSYDGKPEREGLWRAMYAARSALAARELSDGGGK
jgi:hypothetical protein